jgi:membrane protease YdiL (CAAX protease family)
MYFVAPLMIKSAVFLFHLPLVYVCFGAFVVFLICFRDKLNLHSLQKGLNFEIVQSIFTFFVFSFISLVIFIGIFSPDHLFVFSESLDNWIKGIILYCLLSVFPQEFIYRQFFFERYSVLFRNKTLMIVLNGIVFAFAHIIFNNPIAIISTFLFGMLLAWRYINTKSVWAVYLEHCLWGSMVFLIGLEPYFYTGIPDPTW